MDPVVIIVVGSVCALVGATLLAGILDPDRRQVRPATAQERREIRTQRLACAAALVYVVGTFTWRVRTAEALSESPVDSAAVVRIAADIVATGLAILSFIGGRSSGRLGGPGSPATLFSLYTGVVIVGASVAVAPGLVMFRGMDLVACLVVALAVARTHTLEQAVGLLRWILLGLASLVGLSVVIAPSSALFASRGGLVTFRLQGVYPQMAANSVGSLGLMLVAVGLGSRRWRPLCISVGVTFVLLSQYRTGYVALAVLLVVYLFASGVISRKVLALLAVPALIAVTRTTLFRDAWIRGETASRSAETLSGRLEWWPIAIQTAERSPWIGTGLTSGTRYEVLARLGLDTTSTIHSTWVEAYVGTGLLGLLLLGWLFLRGAWLAFVVRRISAVPLLVVITIGVRSFTGTTIELASLSLLTFLLMSLEALKVRAAPVEAEVGPATSPARRLQ